MRARLRMFNVLREITHDAFTKHYSTISLFYQQQKKLGELCKILKHIHILQYTLSRLFVQVRLI